MAKIIRVDMTDLKVISENVPDELEHLGGRALTSHMVCTEVPPTCHPLGKKNKLIFAPGLLGGTSVPNSGRLSIGAKSPLTGGIKEANVGGTAGHKLGRLRIKAIVLEGIPPRDDIYMLKVDKDGAILIPADKFQGLKITRQSQNSMKHMAVTRPSYA